MAKRNSYTDEYRASAVALLEGAGYPDKEGALSQMARHLRVPARTLSRWFNGEQNPPPDQLVNEKKADLVETINAELTSIFAAMGKARDEASYKDLTTAAGILIDKRQLLSGGATERAEVSHKIHTIEVVKTSKRES